MSSLQIFLVYLDGTPSSKIALKMACMRSKNLFLRENIKVDIMLLSVIQEYHQQIFLAANDAVRRSAKDNAELILSDGSDIVREYLVGELPIIKIENGEIGNKIKEVIESNNNIIGLFIGANLCQKKEFLEHLDKIVSSINITTFIVPENITESFLSLIS